MKAEERERKKEQAARMKMIGRALEFTGTRLILLALAVMLCLCVLMSAFRLSNAYIIINEGMAARAEHVLTHTSLTGLRQFFTDPCIVEDTRLKDTAYSEYVIGDYTYSLAFDSLKVWPWRDTITAEIVETVTRIEGTTMSGDAAVPPAWTPLKYRVVMVKQNGCWMIDTLTVLEVNPYIEPPATPDPNMTPMPMATPTPKPLA